MNVYERMDELRRKKGITWKYLNEHIPGTAYSSRMTELKREKTSLSINQLKVAAEILGTTVDYLLGDTNNQQPPEQKENPSIQENDIKAAFFRGADPTLTEEEMDLLWEDARTYMMYNISKRRKKEQ